MKSVIVVSLPSRAADHPDLGDIIERAKELAREIEEILNMKHETIETIQSSTKTAEPGSFVITLPRDASRHPSLVTAWKKVIAFTKEVEDSLSLRGLTMRINFVSTAAA